MNEEEYLVSLEKELKPVLKKYINSREPINHGRTVTSTQLSIENCMDDMDDIQKDMALIGARLKKETGIAVTDELNEGIQTLYFNVLKTISNYRITGEYKRVK